MYIFLELPDPMVSQLYCYQVMAIQFGQINQPKKPDSKIDNNTTIFIMDLWKQNLNIMNGLFA